MEMLNSIFWLTCYQNRMPSVIVKTETKMYTVDTTSYMYTSNSISDIITTFHITLLPTYRMRNDKNQGISH